MADNKGVNSSEPTTAEVVGGVYNTAPPVLVDGQAAALQLDVNGNLKTTSGGGGATGNVNITGVNSNPPALTNPLPVELSDGTQAVGTAGNPLSVNVITGGGSNASVGATGATAPTSATEVGIIDGGGKLQGVSVSNPLPSILESGSTTIAEIEGHAGAILDGTAGSPSTGVLTVQGVSGGTAIPVSGTVTTTPPANASTNITELNSVALGSPTDWGTAPATSVEVIPVNAEMFVGQNPVSASAGVPVTPATSAIFEVSPTTAANTATNPFFERLTDGTNPMGLMTTYGSAPSGYALPVNAYITNTPAVQTINSQQSAETTASWTSGTAQNTTLQLNCVGYSSVGITISTTSPVAAVVTFEVSDTTAFTNAFLVPATRIGATNTAATSTYALVSSTNAAFVIPVAGFAAVRVRLSTAITGAGTASIGITASAIPFTPDCSLGVTYIASAFVSSAVADNLANVTYLPSSSLATNPELVADSVYGGAFSGAANAALQGWSKRRAPTVFKTAQATASGNTAVWTPGSGNKFRLLKVFVELTDNASLASGAVLTISFQDATTAINIAFDVFVPTTAVTTVIGDGLEQELDLGDFGILSAAANNVLNVNLSATLSTGNVRVIAMGTEE
jgi:hypothetical protein